MPESTAEAASGAGGQPWWGVSRRDLRLGGGAVAGMRQCDGSRRPMHVHTHLYQQCPVASSLVDSGSIGERVRHEGALCRAGVACIRGWSLECGPGFCWGCCGLSIRLWQGQAARAWLLQLCRAYAGCIAAAELCVIVQPGRSLSVLWAVTSSHSVGASAWPRVN